MCALGPNLKGLREQSLARVGLPSCQRGKGWGDTHILRGRRWREAEAVQAARDTCGTAGQRGRDELTRGPPRRRIAPPTAPHMPCPPSSHSGPPGTDPWAGPKTFHQKDSASHVAQVLASHVA